MMISGATRVRGGKRLGAHLEDHHGANDETCAGVSRGLVTSGIYNQVQELTDIAAHARSHRPLYHVHVDPERTWSAAEWDRYWKLIEMEFGLRRQPFAEAIHAKHGRAHRHRVYSLVTDDGSCINTSHDYARREKLSRIAEAENGERFTAGRHNQSVIAALRSEGREDVASAMEAAELHVAARPCAPLSPAQRQQQERTQVRRADIATAALHAWRGSDCGPAFGQALADHGLRLVQGDDALGVLDLAGGFHPLRKLLDTATRAGGFDTRITAAAITDRLGALELPARIDTAARPRSDQVDAIAAEPGPPPLPPPKSRHAFRRMQPARPEMGTQNRDDRRTDAGRDPSISRAPVQLALPILLPVAPAAAAPAHHRRQVAVSAAKPLEVDRRLQEQPFPECHIERPAAPSVASDVLAVALQASDDGVARILATAPWPDPASRDAATLARAAQQAKTDRLEMVRAVATAAKREAHQAWQHLGFFSRIGLPTASRRRAKQLAAEAQEAERQAALCRENCGREAVAIGRRAAALAAARQREQDAWIRRAEVQAAMRDRQGNRLVRAALTSGDRDIMELAMISLDVARARMLRRLRAEQRRPAQQGSRPQPSVLPHPASIRRKGAAVAPAARDHHHGADLDHFRRPEPGGEIADDDGARFGMEGQGHAGMA